MTVFAIVARFAAPPPPPATDDDLVERFRRGEPEAFTAIYRAHGAAVFRRLTRIVGPIGDREDLIQDVFLAIHRALPKFRGEAQLATLIQRITVNIACDYLRRRYRRPTTPLPAEFFDELITPGTSPETAAQQREELASVFECLSQIKPKKRVALLLRVVDGMTLEEIARLVDATPDTVAKRIQYGQRELDALLAARSTR